MVAVTDKEIEFSQDREHWHTGCAERGDLFYRTRAVIDGTPTRWKAFLMPICFIGAPLWQVWQMMRELEPYPVEAYDEFVENLDRIKDTYNVGKIQDTIKARGTGYKDQ